MVALAVSTQISTSTVNFVPLVMYPTKLSYMFQK